MNKNRILAMLLAIVMVFSIMVVPAFAAEEDFSVKVVVTDTTIGSVPGVSVDVTVKTNATPIKGAVASVTFDPAVFSMVKADGSAVTLGESRTEFAKDSGAYTANTAYDTVNKMTAALKNGVGVVGIQCVKTSADQTYADYTSVGTFYLAYQDGKTKADITGKTLAWPENAVAKYINYSAAVSISPASGSFAFGKSNPAQDSAALKSASSIVAANFEFAREPLTGSIALESTGTVATPKFGDTLSVNVASLTPADHGTLSYKWYRGDEATGEPIATTATYQLVQADIGSKITVQVDSEVYKPSAASTATTAAAVAKADAGVAVTPTLTKTATTVTVTNVTDGQEYAIVLTDGAAEPESGWQTTAVFGSAESPLEPGTGYTVYTRVKETATTNKGAAVTATETTDKANPTVTVTATQNVVKTTGDFVAPTFKDVKSQTLEGTVTYEGTGGITVAAGSGADAINTALHALNKGDTAAIAWTFTPTANTKYNTATGTINVTIVDILFKKGSTNGTDGTIAVEADLTEKADATYGDTWATIVTVPSTIEAWVGANKVAGTFTVVDATDASVTTPAAGDKGYKVLFTDSLSEHVYNNVEVLTGTATVAQKAVTVTGIAAADKEYDGDTTVATADLSGGAVSGKVGEDAVTVDLSGATGTAASADVANSVNVTLSGVALSGAAASNYTLSAQPTTTVKITPKTLTTSGAITATNKPYDKTTTIVLDSSALALVGVVDNDDVTLSAAGVTGATADADAAASKAVTITGDYTLTGAKAGNYTLTQPTKTGVTVTISPVDVTPVVTTPQTVVVGDGQGAFVQPTFTGVGGEALTGTLTYTITGVKGGAAAAAVATDVEYDDAKTALAGLDKDTDATIAWSFTPTYASNYNSLTSTTDTQITANMKDITFKVGTAAADATNAFAVKEATYGTAWSKIVTIADVKADVAGNAVDGTYYISVDSGVTDAKDAKPDAGAAVAFGIYFTDKATPHKYEGIKVAEGTAKVDQAQIKVTAKNQSIFIGGTVPDLSTPVEGTHYTITGIVDDATVNVSGLTLTYCNDDGTPATLPIDTSATATFLIKVSGVTAPTANYTLVPVDGQFNINRRSSGGRDDGRGGATGGDTTVPEKPTTETVRLPDGTVAVVTTQPGGAVSAKVTVPGGVQSKLTIPVKGVTTSMYPVVVNKDGTEEPIRFSANTEDGITVLVDSSAEVKIVNHNHHFVDTTNHWAEDNIHFVHSRELFNGVDADHFAPESAMTRSMLATVLFRLDGENKGDVEAAFSDVVSDTWYTDGVAWAADKGIVTGYPDGTFAPDANVTREQLATMLYRYAGTTGLVMMPRGGMDGLDFVDADQISDYAEMAMSWACQNGILTGKPGKVADPAGFATRAEVATVLQRFVTLCVK